MQEHPIVFTQCTTYNGVTGNSSSLLFEISDFSARDYQGTSETDYVAKLQCSMAAAGCDRIRIEDEYLQDISVDPVVDATR